MNSKKIIWNGFHKYAMHKYPEEVCAFLYSDKPFEDDGKWFIFRIKNVAEDKRNSWVPDKKEMRQIKKKATNLKLIKIGNIHSHPIINDIFVEELLKPSEVDLKFAKRFNDIIRGIVVVSEDTVYGTQFHDMFGRKIDICLEEFDSNFLRT